MTRTEADVLAAVRTRCVKAVSDLHEMAYGMVVDEAERRRLNAKARGVTLAISYIDEEIRRGL